MKLDTHNVTVYKLTITKEEALWLKKTTQNSPSFDKELPKDSEIREKFFNTLPAFSELMEK